MERGNECRNILRSKGQVPFSRRWGRKMGFQLVGHFVLALSELGRGFVNLSRV